jgi:hypothetical protein
VDVRPDEREEREDEKGVGPPVLEPADPPERQRDEEDREELGAGGGAVTERRDGERERERGGRERERRVPPGSRRGVEEQDDEGDRGDERGEEREPPSPKRTCQP